VVVKEVGSEGHEVVDSEGEREVVGAVGVTHVRLARAKKSPTWRTSRTSRALGRP